MTTQQDQIADDIRRYEKAKSDRANFESRWQEVADYVLPTRQFTSKMVPGQARTNLIFNTTAVNCHQSLTAIMHGEAYRQSAVIARDHGGPFLEYDINQKPFLRVIGKHRDAAYHLAEEGVPADVLEASRKVFDEALELGRDFGYRNAQVTVLAPTGTIAFMMDCDTTGVEPDIALIKYKKLVRN